MGDRRRGLHGLKPLTKEKASEIPGVKEWLASDEGKRSKRSTVPWEIVGGLLWKWWNDQEGMLDAIRADATARTLEEMAEVTRLRLEHEREAARGAQPG